MPDGRPGPVAELQEMCFALLAATGASRTTVRLIDPDGEIRLVAEARADGVESMADGPQANVRAAPTYIELEKHLRPIYQSDTRSEPPAPPPSLVEHYRVWAQMLAAVVVDGRMVATISVHQQDTARVWTASDRSALATAERRVVAWCQAHHRPPPAGGASLRRKDPEPE